MPRLVFQCAHCSDTFVDEQLCVEHERPCAAGELRQRGRPRGRKPKTRPKTKASKLEKAISKAISVTPAPPYRLPAELIGLVEPDVAGVLEDLVARTLDQVEPSQAKKKNKARQRLLEQLEHDDLMYGARTKKARKSRAPQRLELDAFGAAGYSMNEPDDDPTTMDPNYISSHDCCDTPYQFIRKRRKQYRNRNQAAPSQVVADTSSFSGDVKDLKEDGGNELRPRIGKTSNGKFPYECPECHLKCKSGFDVQVHMMRKHTGERPYKCPHPGCGRAFVTPYALDNHRETHKIRNKDFLCVACQVGFKSDRNLRKHMDVYHSDMGSYRCDECDLTFKSEAKMQSHKNQAHRATGQFQCPRCPRKFVNSYTVNRHILSRHEDVRPFKCEHCPDDAKTFQSLQDLKYHTRVAHPAYYDIVKKLTLADFPEAKMIMAQNAFAGETIVKAAFPVNKNAVDSNQQSTSSAGSSLSLSSQSMVVPQPPVRPRVRQTKPSAPQPLNPIAQNLQLSAQLGHQPLNYVTETPEDSELAAISTQYINVQGMPMNIILQPQQQHAPQQVIATSSHYLPTKLQPSVGYWPTPAHQQQPQHQLQTVNLIGYQLQPMPTTSQNSLINAAVPTQVPPPMNFNAQPFLFNSFMQ